MKKSEQYRELMRRIFDEMQDGLSEKLKPGEYENRRELFSFHMTDWLDDLSELSSLRDDCSSVDTKQASRFVAGFLYHVIPHLTEAGNLLLDDVPNPFSNDEK